MNYRMIRNILGWLLVFECGFMLVPAVTALVYRESQVVYFLLTMVLCGGIGGLLVYRKPQNSVLYAREGFIIVALSWMVLSLFGALPFFLSGCIPNYVDALFETVSGFTTTGASILSDVESLPRCMLIWRSFTHWVGGMGVLVFMMAFIPLSGGQNMHIMKAESPGPSVSKLVPRVKTTALILYSIYLVMTLVMFILLLFGRMSPFAAINTAFGTAGTGGFGLKNDSIASYSPYIQNVCTTFMLLFGVNFGCYYLLLLKQVRGVLRDEELRLYLGLVFGSILLITLNIRGMYGTIWESLRHAAFQVSSIITTTGFSTVDFDLWPAFSKGILLILMLIGACAGSTGGGLKCARLLLILKGVKRNLAQMIHPQRVQVIRVNEKAVSEKVLANTNAYLCAYTLIMVISVLVVSLDGFSVITNASAVIACFNNIGPGLDAVGPACNFSDYGVLSKLVLILDMLAGRLEIFPILALFSVSTWKRTS